MAHSHGVKGGAQCEEGGTRDERGNHVNYVLDFRQNRAHLRCYKAASRKKQVAHYKKGEANLARRGASRLTRNRKGTIQAFLSALKSTFSVE